MALGVELGLGPGHIVLDGDPAPFPPKGAEQSSSQLRHISTIDTEVSLSLGDILLDGNPPPLP